VGFAIRTSPLAPGSSLLPTAAMKKFLAGIVEFFQGLAVLVAVFAAQAALYWVVVVIVGVAVVLFFVLLSFLPEGIAHAIMGTLDLLARIARIGVRDGAD